MAAPAPRWRTTATGEPLTIDPEKHKYPRNDVPAAIRAAILAWPEVQPCAESHPPSSYASYALYLTESAKLMKIAGTHLYRGASWKMREGYAVCEWEWFSNLYEMEIGPGDTGTYAAIRCLGTPPPKEKGKPGRPPMSAEARAARDKLKADAKAILAAQRQAERDIAKAEREATAAEREEARKEKDRVRHREAYARRKAAEATAAAAAAGAGSA